MKDALHEHEIRRDGTVVEKQPELADLVLTNMWIELADCEDYGANCLRGKLLARLNKFGGEYLVFRKADGAALERIGHWAVKQQDVVGYEV